MDRETVKLVRSAQTGDTEAFHRLVSCYDHQVMSLALKLIENRQDAEDIYQEVFMKVFKNIKKFRFESDFSTWLYRITTNTAFNFRRKMAKHRHIDPLEEGSDNFIERIPAAGNEPSEGSQEAREDIMKAVVSLPQRQRTVFVLKHMESVKIKDIAALLGCTEGTVKKYLFRAVEKLRHQLGEYRYA